MTYITQITVRGWHYVAVKDEKGHIIGEAWCKTLLGVSIFLKTWGILPQSERFKNE